MVCSFCQSDTRGIIHSTKYWNIFLSDDQTYLGRSIIVLKRHCKDLAELKKEEWLDFIGVVKIFESSLRKSFQAMMFNWTCLMNDAYKDKNPQPHVHWHVRPRYNHPVKIAGLIFEDKDFAHHYARGTDRKLSGNARKIIINEIKKNY